MDSVRNVLAVAVVFVLCRNCSAQVGGCTPPAGSNLTGGTGKLSNNIPQSNCGGPGREFYMFDICLMFIVLFQNCEESLEAMG